MIRSPQRFLPPLMSIQPFIWYTPLCQAVCQASIVLGEKGCFQLQQASPIHTTVVGRAGDPRLRPSKFYMGGASLRLLWDGHYGHLSMGGDTAIEWWNFISNTQGMYGLPCEYRWFLHFPSEKPERLWYETSSLSKLFMHRNEALPLTDMDPPKPPH